MGGTPAEEYDYAEVQELPSRGKVQPPALQINPKVTAAGLAGAFCIALFALLSEFGIDLTVTTVTSSTVFLTALAGYLMPNGRHDN